MRLTHVKVEYGCTQNIGDYSNVKPSIVIEADLEEGDSAKKTIDKLVGQALEQMHAIVDDEMENVGMKPRYYDGPLFHIHLSEIRKCFVLSPKHVKLPEESNWKDRDSWYGPFHQGLRLKDNMRPKTAMEIWKAFEPKDGYIKVDCMSGDFSTLPPLPDVGPEPAWHSKALDHWFRQFHVLEERWGELGELEHVTDDYCKTLRNVQYTPKWPKGDIADFIRDNASLDQLFPPEPDPVDEDEDWDEDEEEYEDDPEA